jgi:hypothetical protein
MPDDKNILQFVKSRLLKGFARRGCALCGCRTNQPRGHRNEPRRSGHSEAPLVNGQATREESALKIENFKLSIQKTFERSSCLFECRTNCDDRLGEHQVIDATEILDFVSILVTSVTGSDGPAAPEDSVPIKGKIVGVRDDKFSLAACIAHLPSRSNVRRRAAEGSNIRQQGVAGIDQPAVRPEDGVGVRWEVLTRFLRIEREDALYAQSVEKFFPVRGDLESLRKENIRACKINAGD